MASARAKRERVASAINFAKIAADLDTNPKVRRAGRNGREVFCFILRRVALHKAQGRVPVSNVDPWYLADQLQMTEADAEQGLAACLRPYQDRPGLLEIKGGDVVVTGWNDDWGRYPMDEAERKRRERARERAQGDDLETTADVDPEADSGDAGEGECPDVSGHVTQCPDSHGSDQIRSDQIRSLRESGGAGARDPSEPVFSPSTWSPEPTDANTLAALDAKTRGVVVEYALRKFRARAGVNGWTELQCAARWPEYLARERPDDSAREALVRVDRERGDKAARDRERLDLEAQRQRAEADREDVRRAAKDALDTNFRLPTEKSTA